MFLTMLWMVQLLSAPLSLCEVIWFFLQIHSFSVMALGAKRWPVLCMRSCLAQGGADSALCQWPGQCLGMAPLGILQGALLSSTQLCNSAPQCTHTREAFSAFWKL